MYIDLKNGELNRDMFLLFILRKVDTVSARNITTGVAIGVYAPHVIIRKQILTNILPPPKPNKVMRFIKMFAENFISCYRREMKGTPCYIFVSNALSLPIKILRFAIRVKCAAANNKNRNVSRRSRDELDYPILKKILSRKTSTILLPEDPKARKRASAAYGD